MRHFLYALLVLWLATPVMAQAGYGSNSLVTYDIKTLTYRPGVIWIHPKYMTVVEFAEALDEVGTSVPTLMQVKLSDAENMLFLRALKNVGSGDLIVRVGGYVAMFRVVVDSRMEQPRRYLVTIPNVPATSAAPAPSTAAPRPSTTTTPAPARPTPAPRDNAPQPQGSNPAPQQPSADSRGGFPEWLVARMTFARNDETLVAYYDIRNNGSETLRLLTENLTVQKAGARLPFRLVRTTFGQNVDLIQPGEQVTGAIMVPNAPEGVEFQWKILDSKGNTYLLRNRAEP